MAEPEQAQNTNWLRDFVLLFISRFCIFFSFRQMQPVFPVYLAKLGASGTLIGFVMASLTVTAMVSRPFVGLLIDRSGRKKFLLLGIGIFAISTLGYSWAPSIIFLVAFRILHGLGWSSCTTAVSTLAADIAPSQKRGTVIAYAGLASNLGAALGPIAGFAAYERFGFHGMFLTVFGVISLSLPFSIPINDPHVPSPHERRRRSWLQLLFVRESLLPAVTMTFIAFGHSGTSTFIPLYVLQNDLGNPALFFAVEAVSVLLSRPIAGPLSDRFSRRAVILPGQILQIIGLILVALAPSASILLVAAAINGLGVAFAHPALMALAIDRVPSQRRGLSMAQFQTFHELGNVVGAIMLGSLLDMMDKNFSAMYLVSAAVVSSGLVLFGIFGKEHQGGNKA